MKKVLISVVAMVACAFTANAQLWLGGSLSASHSGGVEKNVVVDIDDNGKDVKDDIDDPKYNSFSFAPMIGFDLSDKFAVGATVSFSTSTSNKSKDDDDKKYCTKSNTFGIAPFIRYSVAEFGKFNVKLQASVPMSMTNGKTVRADKDTKAAPSSSIGVNAYPLLSYEISDKFNLECALNFMSLSFSHSVAKESPDATDYDKKHKDIVNSFQFGASNRLLNVGSLSIGFIYKL